MARYAKQQKQTPSYKASTKGMNKSPGQGWKFAGRKETFHRAVVDSNVEVTHRDKFKKEREWINSTLFVFEHDGNLWRGVCPTPVLSRSRWLQHEAEIRPRQILRGAVVAKRKKKEGWRDERRLRNYT
ncbi:Uncharacterized protein DBV15_04763 [Temnothorax longispinosus]|uniref:Uncharacterized protein n=1 Tax=Temnothorax longispinosus TaxID=300112 RepID=A0A4S2L0E9_9HYME|nr:Uncharacterized protein DBV15_04763 [Temnothorax longispinosus]